MKLFCTFFFLFVFSINLLAEPAVKYFEFTMKSEEHIPFLQVKSSAKDSMIVQTLSNEPKTVSLWDIQKITKFKDPASNGVDVLAKWVVPIAISFGIGGIFGGMLAGVGYLVGFCIPQEETDLSQVNEISQKKEMILKIISSSTQN